MAKYFTCFDSSEFHNREKIEVFIFYGAEYELILIFAFLLRFVEENNNDKLNIIIPNNNA